MPATRETVATSREYRNIVPIEGYVHKFRLESREEAAVRSADATLAVPTVCLRALLGKFVLVAVALAGIGVAGARVLI